MTLEIRLFGKLTVLSAGQVLPPLRSRQGQGLLALLVLRRGGDVEREWLALTLWPESSPKQARYNLRRNLTDLRQILGAESGRLLTPTSHSLAFNLKEVKVDVLEFDAALRTQDLARLEKAVALYQGTLLEGVSQNWLLPEREARTHAYVNILEMLASLATQSHDFASAVGYLRQALTTDPLRENALRALMEALTARGEKAALKQVYRDFRLYLYRELHTEPAEETTALYHRLLSQENTPAEASVALPNVALPNIPSPLSPHCHLPALLTNLIGREEESAELQARLHNARLLTLTGMGGIGKTRLAIAVAEAVGEEFPDGIWFIDLSSLTDASLIPSVLASTLGILGQATSSPLVTVTDYLRPRQILLLVDNCEHLLEGCALTLDSLLRACPRLHVLATSRQALGLTGEVAWRVPPLSLPPPQMSSPALRQQDKEEKNRLSLLLEFPTVRLFVERAYQVRSDFRLTLSEGETIAQICRHLDGIPLALELAAARIATLSPADILLRLKDRFQLLTSGSRAAYPRHKTLQALLDWSYQLLTEAEKELFLSISIFSGGWTLAAAEAVCGNTSGAFAEDGNASVSLLSIPCTLDNLSSLVEKSLVVYEAREGGGRYRLLETVRKYSRERWGKSLEKQAWLGRCHALYYTQLAEEGNRGLSGADQGEWLARLDAEQDNFRAALNWCQAAGEEDAEERDRAALGVRLAGRLCHYWERNGSASEGRKGIQAVIEKNGIAQATPELAYALRAASGLAHSQGDYAQATEYGVQALEMERTLGDREGEARVLKTLGEIAANQGNHVQAKNLMEQALALFREIGDLQEEAWCLGTMGYIVRSQGDLLASLSLTEEALRLHRELGNERGEVWCLGSLGTAYSYLRDYAKAQALYERSITIHRRTGERGGEAWNLCSLGEILRDQGRYAESLPLLEQGYAIYREMDLPSSIAWSLGSLGETLHALGRLPEARTAIKEALTITRHIGSRRQEASHLRRLAAITANLGDLSEAYQLYAEVITLICELDMKRERMETLEGLAEVALEREQWEQAAQLYGAANALRQSQKAPHSLAKLLRYEAHIAQIKAVLGEATFEAAMHEGQTMVADQATVAALIERQRMPFRRGLAS